MDIPATLRVSPVQVPADPPSGGSISPKKGKGKRKRRRSTVRPKAKHPSTPAPATTPVAAADTGQGSPPKAKRIGISPAVLPLVDKTFGQGSVPGTFVEALDQANPNWRQGKAHIPGGYNKFEEVDPSELVASGKSPILGALRAAAQKVEQIISGTVSRDAVTPQLAKLVDQLEQAHTTEAFIKKVEEWAPTNAA